MSSISWSEYHEIDRGTITFKEKTKRLALLESLGTPYINYEERAGSGISTASLELKRYIDKTIISDFKKNICSITENRFKNIYADVRIYSAIEQDEEFLPWENQKPKKRKKTDLFILINFVLAIPKNDSLDSMTRATINSFFGELDWAINNKKIISLQKKLKFSEKLNIITIVNQLDKWKFNGFPPKSDSKISMEIDCDGVIEKDFAKLEKAALGPDILKSRITKSIKLEELKPITAKNASAQVPLLIAHISKALGVLNIDPNKLDANDNLYALMGYDEKLSLSLQKSICLHFNVLSWIGANEIVTVGNAISFARDILEMNEQTD
jgi:hypothetical protein